MKTPIRLEEMSGVGRSRESVTLGVPVRRGDAREEEFWTLRVGDETFPVQTEVLDRWGDGSPKWVLCDFAVPVAAGEKKSCELSDVPHSPEISGLRVREHNGKVSVETGAAVFTLDRGAAGILSRVDLAGGPGFDLKESRWLLSDEGERETDFRTRQIGVELAGKIRARVRAEGVFSAGKREAARFFARFTFFAGSARVKIEWTLWNPRRAMHRGNCWDLGDPGSLLFRELRFDLRWRGDAPRRLYWRAFPDDAVRSENSPPWSLYQESSGGPNWHSTNHVNREGKIPLRFSGYRARAGDSVLEGLRAQPAVAVSSGGLHIAASLERFWQNFPKSLEWDGETLSFGIFPALFPDLHELQGGERKTHALHLDFGTGNPENACRSAGGFALPVSTRIEPEAVAASGVFPHLTLPDQDPRPEYRNWIREAVEGRGAFAARREITDEYGWRHFGCLVADHEMVGAPAGSPRISHYNNQYDPLFGFLLQHWRTGDEKWRELALDAARHTMDIDLYHTDEDKAAYSGGYFWHTEHYRDAGLATHRTYTAKPMESGSKPSRGGGPSCEHNYTTGLTHYYFMTGDPLAKETVAGLADWVLNMEDGKKSPLRFLDRGDTGMSTRTAENRYHGPGRGAGNSINALLDAHLLTREKRYLEQAEKLIRRCCHPRDDIRARKLDQPEIRWTYLIFFQALGRYLDWKMEAGQTDRMFFYARESLLHYARWMLENEKPYSEMRDKVLIWTESWPAMDMRKSEVFKFAAIHSGGEMRKECLEKSKYFYGRCLDDLRGFETRSLTRPLAVLFSNGVSHGAFHRDEDRLTVAAESAEDFATPEKFVPQRVRALCKLAAVMMAAAALALGALLLRKGI